MSAPETWRDTTRCGIDNCRSKDYYREGGYTYCSQGHLQHAVPSTQPDEDDFGTQGRKTKQKKEEEVTASQNYSGAEALKLYLQSYQFILWKQCYVLIHNMGLPAELEVIVKDLWSLRLQLLQDRVDASSQENTVFSSQNTSTNDLADQDGQRGRERLSRSRTVPSLIDSLGTCYLGIILLRLPISIGDIHRWAYKEDIPYMRAVRFVPRTMKDKLPATYLMALDTQSVLEADDFRKAVHELSLFYSEHFEMAFPVLNHPLLLFKHIRALALPLEIFPAVRRMARLLDIKFTFPTPRSRQRISTFPEIALMALLVIAVKIYHPFDAAERNPRSIDDLGLLALDWDYWCKAHTTQKSEYSSIGKLQRGDEIQVKEEDIFKLSGDQIDTYLDWFEKTWIDEERARKRPRGYPEQLLDMFPTGRSDGSIPTAVDPKLERQKDDEEVEEKLRAVQGSLKPRQVVHDDDVKEPDDKLVNRIGSNYKRCKKREDLTPTEKAFYQAAADLVAIKPQSLLVAVAQIENKLLSWRKKQLKKANDLNDDVAEEQRENEHSERALTDSNVQMGADTDSSQGEPGTDSSRRLYQDDLDDNSDSVYEKDSPM